MNWIRLSECPICGKGRCKQDGRRIYCFRFSSTFFIDKESNISGKGIKNIPVKKSNKQKELNFSNNFNNYDSEDLF